MKATLSATLLFISCHLFGQQVSFKIEIGNLQSSDGSIIVSIFEDQKEFEDDRPTKRISILKKDNMDTGIFEAELTLPPDTYGLALVDDENNDGEMNFNWMGMPKEGFGFSNYYHSGLSRPKFSDFSFNLTEGIKTLKMKIKYM